jgi:hypothetical protein
MRLRVGSNLFLSDDPKPAFELLADNLAEFLFLLGAEQQLCRVENWSLQRRTTGLGLYQQGEKKTQRNAEWKTHARSSG